MVMSTRPRRLGIAETKSHLAEIVREAASRRTIIQRRGRDVAVVIGVEELARLERAGDGATAGAQLLARLARVKERYGAVDDFAPGRASIEPLEVFASDARPAKRR